MSKLYRSLLWSGLLVAGVAACGDDVLPPPPPPPPAPIVHSLTVAPDGIAIQAGTTLQMLASVNADAGVATTVTWSVNTTGTNAPSINATTGLLTTVASFGAVPGVAVQACATANTAVCDNATISVQVAPVSTATVTGVNVQPPAATVNKPVSGSVNVSLSAAVAGANGPTQVVQWAIVGTAPAGASITAAPTAAGGVLTITSATPAGSFNVRACATVVGFEGVCGFSTISVATVPSANISINSVTAGAGTPGAGLPVNINAVIRQIDVNLNFDPNGQSIDSVRIQFLKGGAFRTAAKQVFGGAIPAAGLLTLSVNTANFSKCPVASTVASSPCFGAAAGTAVVDWFNGPNTLQAQVFPTAIGTTGAIDCQIAANDPTCTTPLAMIFMNVDGWAADIWKCTATAATTAGAPGSTSGTAPPCPAASPVAANASPPTNSTGGFATNVGGAAATIGNTYWGGPTASGATTAEIYPVVYNNNPSFAPGSSLNRCQGANGVGCITAVSWTLGTPTDPDYYPLIPPPAFDGQCTIFAQPVAGGVATLPFVRVFSTPTLTGGTACAYQNTVVTRDNINISVAIDGQNNPFPLVGVGAPALDGIVLTLIPNAVVFGATPDSLRLDYVPPSVTAPAVSGSENINWVNANWNFTPFGALGADGGVGAAGTTWRAFATVQGGSGLFVTPVTTGADLAETNQNCVGAGCDGYLIRASAVDRLGNGANSINGCNTPTGPVVPIPPLPPCVTFAFGVDKTAPVVRYSTLGTPSFYAPIYVQGGAPTVLDSTTYNAIWGVYGANVVTAGAQTLFLAAAAGTNDSFRIEALDNRSGLSRAVLNTIRFSQAGTVCPNPATVNGLCTTIFATTTGAFTTPATIDGWLPAPALHATNGRAGGAPPVTPGYFTNTGSVIDRAGNISGCPVSAVFGAIATAQATAPTSPASVCTVVPAGGPVAPPNITGGTNPAVPGVASANLFFRRTLALDPGQPVITGVSPNNSYTGNSPQTWALGASDDLEVIDGRLRIQYPNVTTGDVPGTIPATQGLVYSYSLSSTFYPNNGNNTGPNVTLPTAATGAAYGFFAPIGVRFDNSIINPVVTGLGSTPAMTLDQFTLNVQETCTNAAGPPPAGVATGPATATFCTSGTTFVGDPITTGAGGFPITKPNNIGAQVRDVFGSWIFNTTGGAAFGVSAELVTAILAATVTTVPAGYSVGYSGASLCPQGGVSGPGGCVTSGINWRADGGTGSTRNFRAVQALSITLPVFNRVDLFGLNAAGEWVFVQRCIVPTPVIPNTGPQACGVGGATGTVTGTDNGLERYWVYSFTGIPTTGFTFFRALGVNGTGSASGPGIPTVLGSGLFSTRQP